MSIPTDEEYQAALDAMRDDELEALIADVVARKNAAAQGSAKRRFLIRQLAGLRYSRELAGPIIEELDPYWCECSLSALARRGS